MTQQTHYYVVRKKAVPEVLLKVVEAKRLMETGECATIQDASDRVGISRSSFYKYKDDIFPFHQNARGKTISLFMQTTDRPGILSDVLKIVAECGANIMSIHQGLPVGGLASITLSLGVLPSTGDVSAMIEGIEKTGGVRQLKILGEE